MKLAGGTQHAPTPTTRTRHTHTRAVHPDIALDPTVTEQPQHQHHPSKFDPMDHDINYDEVGKHPPNTSGHTLTRRKPILQTPQNTKPTINPEIQQTPRQTNTTHTHTHETRLGAEHTIGLGVRPPGPIWPSQHPNRELSLPKTPPDCHDSPQQAGRSVPSTPSTPAQREPTTQVPADTQPTINFKNDQAQYLTTTTHSRDATGLQVGAEHTLKSRSVLNTLKD